MSPNVYSGLVGFALVLLLANAAETAPPLQLILAFDGTVSRYEVDKLYVNFNIDTGSLYNGLDFSDPKLRTLTQQLGPGGVIRIGGTAVDSSLYFPAAPYNEGSPNQCMPLIPPCINGSSDIGNAMLDAIVGFVQATNMSLLWDMNGESFRTESGAWNPKGNATAMLGYLDQRYGGQVDFAYSVGNEPEFWKPAPSAATLAADAVTLKKLLPAYNIGRTVAGPSYAGISSNNAKTFLPIAAAGGVDFYTVHNYPYGGHDCVVNNYLNKSAVTGNLGGALASIRAVRDSIPGADKILLVLEEVAGSSGGGCENVTDRFVAGFAWMNILNTVADNGFARVHRQDIVGWSFAFGQSHYMLVGPAGWVKGTPELLTPHPDYFTTVLWKQIMGSRILSTQVSGDSTAKAAFNGHFWCSKASGGVVLAWSNSGQDDIALTLPASLATAAAVAFTLTATAEGTPYAALQSDAIFLNGQLLTVDDAGRLPVYPIPGTPAPPAASHLAPAFSYGFLVFPTTAVAACA